VQRRLAEAGLAVDVLGQFSTAPLDRRALVCGYALLPETQAAAAAAVIARVAGVPGTAAPAPPGGSLRLLRWIRAWRLIGGAGAPADGQ
jgi:hypothetical protein